MLRQGKLVAVMHSDQVVLTVIKVVRSLTKLEIKDVDTKHLLHVVIRLAYLHVLGDGLRDAIEHTLQIVELTGLLDFHNDDLALRVTCLDVHTVVLIILRLLIGFTLNQRLNLHLLLDEHGDQALEDHIVRLVAENVLRCPIKSDVLTVTPFLRSFRCFVFLCTHNVWILRLTAAKVREKFETNKDFRKKIWK